MTISGNLPPYYPQEPVSFNLDDDDEKIKSTPKPKSTAEDKPEPKLDNGGLNYVW